MPTDEDRGTGDARHFSAADLERLYRLGAPDTEVRVRGSVLNDVLGVADYQRDAVYLVTAHGVKRL